MLQEQFTAMPKATRIVVIALGVFTLFGLLPPSTRPYLSMNVLYVAPPKFFLWTLYTAGLYDVNIINGIINIFMFIMFGKYLEPIWGSKELIKFISIVNVFTFLSIFILFLFSYMFTGNINFLFSNTCGFSGVIAALIVTLKQLIPDQELPILSLKIRFKDLPSINILISVIFYLLLGGQCSITIIGSLIGWIYLRFYQKKGGVRGDLNESFAFATFFPEPIQSPIKMVSNFVYNFLKMIRICPIGSSNTLPIHNYEVTTQNTADIDRRRALAMKTLEQRMNQQQQQQNQQQNQQEQQEQPPQPPQLYSLNSSISTPAKNIPIDNE